MTREPDDWSVVEERCPSGKGRDSDIPGVSSLSRLSSTLSLPSKQSIVVKPVPGVSARRTTHEILSMFATSSSRTSSG